MNKPRIGFIGIGLMGHGIAKNLVAKGYPLALARASQSGACATTCSPPGRPRWRAMPSSRATPTSSSCA